METLFKKYILIFFLTFTLSIFSQESKENNLSKEIKLGFYIDNIYNIDYLNTSYEVIFYMWANSHNKLYPINLNDIDKSTEITELFSEKDSVEIPNGKEYKYLIKYKAKILNKLDVSKFPFDDIKLNLICELLGHYKGEKIIVWDKKNSSLKPRFSDKYKFKKAEYKIKSINWNSNFGDLKKANDLDSIELSFHLVRNSWNLYWKMFIVLFISFFLASLNLFLPNKKSEEKFALIVGSLFTAIGNKYITESYLPITDGINLSDYIHIITFIFISSYVLYAIYEQRANKKDSFKHDLKLFLFTILSYFASVFIITYNFI
jgi:hypothetical protein